MSQSLLFSGTSQSQVTGPTTAPNTQHGTFFTFSSLTPSTFTSPSFGKPFVPPTVTLKEIHAAVPKDLRKNAWLSAYYCV